MILASFLPRMCKCYLPTLSICLSSFISLWAGLDGVWLKTGVGMGDPAVWQEKIIQYRTMQSVYALLPDKHQHQLILIHVPSFSIFSFLRTVLSLDKHCTVTVQPESIQSIMFCYAPQPESQFISTFNHFVSSTNRCKWISAFVFRNTYNHIVPSLSLSEDELVCCLMSSSEGV